MEFNYGHLFEVGPAGQATRFNFQNFRIGDQINYSNKKYDYLPFGFGGAVASLKGDNLDATLQLANTDITRNWATQALQNLWVGKVTTVLWSEANIARVLYSYWGVCSTGGWDETAIQISLNSVLDAVDANVPARKLTRYSVGNIPFTSAVRV
jgi:hypothetical protein